MYIFMCIVYIHLYIMRVKVKYRLWTTVQLYTPLDCSSILVLLENVILKISAFSNFLFYFFLRKFHSSAQVSKMVYKHNAIIISFPIVINILNSTNNAFV